MPINEKDLTDDARENNTATYCPEDNKIRLYLGERVERDSYLHLRSIGYVATPKQNCSFVSTWNIAAEDAAFALIADDDDIGDEDYSPEDRAADRAERFSGYRDKRRSEAGGHADNYDAGPSAYGYQSQAKADSAANRHDRHRDRALSQWSKAEYWQSRTAGVISHALHRSTAEVRRGRILVIEKEIRQVESRFKPQKNSPIYKQTDGDGVEHDYVICGAGRGGYPTKVSSLDGIRRCYARYLEHLSHRLAYENAMLENEGGKAADVEMEVGGWIGNHQIHRINKSPATGRVVSVHVLAPTRQYANRFGVRYDETNPAPLVLHKINIEKFGANIYRAPTDEERASLATSTKDRKEAKNDSNPKSPVLINPTREDADKLQLVWNRLATERKMKSVYKATPSDAPVRTATQAAYSSNAKGDYGQCSTVYVKVDGSYSSRMSAEAVFKIRTHIYSGGSFSNADSVVVIIDKPQKPLPLDWNALMPPEILAGQLF